MIIDTSYRPTGSPLKSPLKSPAGRVASPKLRQEVGSSRLTALMEERYEQLLEEFNKVDKNGDGEITFEELYEFLSAKQGEGFDQELCRELFQKMDTNSDSVISVNEFLMSYVDTEEAIKREIKVTEKNLHKGREALDNSRKKLLIMRTQEQFNMYGVMQGSVFTVKVVGAEELKATKANGLSDPYVIVSVEDNEISTAVREADLRPVWNEEFSLNVVNGDSTVLVTVMAKHNDKPHERIGSLEIPLEVLRDQKKQDKKYNLLDAEGQETESKLHLTIQWVWSQVKYLEDVVTQMEGRVDREQVLSETLKERLERLQKPFGVLLLSPLPRDYEASIRSSFGYSPSKLESFIVGKLDQYTNDGFSMISQRNSLLIGLVHIFLLVTSVVMFLRPNYLDLAIGLVCYYYLYSHIDDLVYRNLAVAILVSEVLDLLWFYLNGARWLSGGGEDPQQLIRGVIIVLSFANFLLKIVLAGVLWKRSLG